MKWYCTYVFMYHVTLYSALIAIFHCFLLQSNICIKLGSPFSNALCNATTLYHFNLRNRILHGFLKIELLIAVPLSWLSLDVSLIWQRVTTAKKETVDLMFHYFRRRILQWTSLIKIKWYIDVFVLCTVRFLSQLRNTAASCWWWWLIVLCTTSRAKSIHFKLSKKPHLRDMHCYVYEYDAPVTRYSAPEAEAGIAL